MRMFMVVVFPVPFFPKQPQDAPLRDIEAQPLIDEAAAPVALCEVSDRYDVVHKLIGE